MPWLSAAHGRPMPPSNTVSYRVGGPFYLTSHYLSTYAEKVCICPLSNQTPSLAWPLPLWFFPFFFLYCFENKDFKKALDISPKYKKPVWLWQDARSLVIREMEIQSTVKYPFKLLRHLALKGRGKGREERKEKTTGTDKGLGEMKPFCVAEENIEWWKML